MGWDRKSLMFSVTKNQPSVLYFNCKGTFSEKKILTSPHFSRPPRLYQGFGPPSCSTPWQLTIHKTGKVAIYWRHKYLNLFAVLAYINLFNEPFFKYPSWLPFQDLFDTFHWRGIVGKNRSARSKTTVRSKRLFPLKFRRGPHYCFHTVLTIFFPRIGVFFVFLRCIFNH